MIKFSALNESDSSDDDEEEREEGAEEDGVIGGIRGVAATKEAQEAEVVELFKNAIDAQQRGRRVFFFVLSGLRIMSRIVGRF